MADHPTQNFEGFLETDIKRLSEEIETHRDKPEMRTLSEKELLREALHSAIVEKVPVSAPSSGGSAADDVASRSPLPAYAQNASPETKLEIEYLLDLALREGLMKAEAESRKSPEFVQDTFHDALTGRLYPELVRRGILK